MMATGGMPVKKIAQTVAGFSGRQGRNGCGVLCQVLEKALAAMPEELPLGVLCQEVGQQTGKKAEAVYKALSRSIKDIWENGDRQALEQAVGYRLLEEPSPKELVVSLVQALWSQEMDVEYHVLEVAMEQKVGIWARTEENEYVVMPPFSRDRETVSRLVEQWNQEQMPLQKFREIILLGEMIRA